MESPQEPRILRAWLKGNYALGLFLSFYDPKQLRSTWASPERQGFGMSQQQPKPELKNWGLGTMLLQANRFGKSGKMSSMCHADILPPKTECCFKLKMCFKVLVCAHGCKQFFPISFYVTCQGFINTIDLSLIFISSHNPGIVTASSHP